MIEADVIVVRADRDVLAFELWVAAGKNGDDVASRRRRLRPLDLAVNRLARGAPLETRRRRAAQCPRHRVVDVEESRDGEFRLATILKLLLRLENHFAVFVIDVVEARDAD